MVFNISLEKLNDLLKLTEDIAPQVTTELLQYMGVQIQRVWVNELYETTSRKGWGIKAGESVKIDVGKGTVRVYADDREVDARTGQKKILFMNIIEDGIASWSIKDALLRSNRVHISSKGTKYIHVPFRYRVPGSQKPHTYFSGVQPQEVYNIVKGGKTVLKGAEHGRMAGLAKHGREKHSQYYAFRTVSEKSQGWKYPNISPTPVYQKVLNYLDRMIPAVIENFCKAYVDRVKEGK